ncbi:hypothetical protein LA66_06805 [Aureimonas altamirensis]|uniref:Uncharacterized protein n=1 Tax=Aureimonas altamirensis TaxID=370622 RepID=A0A0B1QBF1_9HYPH|nr:hypothetical protein [Aureimonas altamirensis]KHJ56272.1 hypothetical protein LA66_06805 [Aureimonas altamirensis]
MSAYAWYFTALANPSGIGRTPDLSVHESDPQPGFYRKRRGKNGPFDPVAIWFDGDTLVAAVGDNMADPHDVWTWCCRAPVTEEAYRKARSGEGWSDEPPTSQAASEPMTGHNLNSSDPHEALRLEYLGEAEMAREFLNKPIKTQDDADKAAVWSKRLAAIAKKATDHHKVEKQPSLDEGRRIDERWRELKDGAKDLSVQLKRHMDEFLREQDRLERERQRAAAAEADRIRREAEEAAKAAAAVQDDAERAKAEEAAAAARRAAYEAEKEAASRNSTAGRTGAKVALRTFVSAEITDFDALLTALKDRPEIRDVVQSLANRAAKSGVDLPGMKIVEERRAA